MYTRVAVEYSSKVPLLYMYTTKQADKYLHKFQSIYSYLNWVFQHIQPLSNFWIYFHLGTGPETSLFFCSIYR